MARNLHEKAEHKLRKLPRCSKCNIEFALVAAVYTDEKKTVEEWECPKCHKVVPRNLLKEEFSNKDENFIHERCMVINEKDRKAKRNRSKHL
jgi:hypothetical protein